MRTGRHLSLLAIAAACLGACGAHREGLNRRFVRPGEASTKASEPAVAPKQSLAEYMRRVRHLSANARPKPKGTFLPTIEMRDRDLAAALARAAVEPTSAHLRRVAYEYYRLGVKDSAHEYFNRALKADPRDGLAYDGMARIWRDWGLAGLGLADAHRAAYFRPQSPLVHNTLGTVYQALGQPAAARQAYAHAVALDPSAGYALSNLCYLSLLQGRAADAVQECDAAIRVAPALTAARNNLALAHAASGSVARAERELLEATDRATGWYNVGILRMSRHAYLPAREAFDTARGARPAWRAPRERIAQVDRLLDDEAGTGGTR
jgi:Flp pilus assembly protein TadD